MPLPENEAFNVAFVRLVENYKCLYNPTIPEYSSKEDQDKAWNSIGEHFAVTGAECKLRWKYLRGGLTRYIKKLKARTSVHGSKSTKQFYMWDSMQFVIPFLKSRTGRLPPVYIKNEYNEILNEKEDDFADNEEDNVNETSTEEETSETPDQLEMMPTTSLKIRKISKPSPDDSSYERVPVVYDYSSKVPVVEKPDNSDMEFFRSILPDMAVFNASQKRRFKMGVLQVLEDISSEGTTNRTSTPRASSSTKLINNSVSTTESQIMSGQSINFHFQDSNG